MQTDTKIFIRNSLEKLQILRKLIIETIQFIENKINQLKNNEITINDYVNTLVYKYKYRINLINM
jgi:hypothetical protein